MDTFQFGPKCSRVGGFQTLFIMRAEGVNFTKTSGDAISLSDLFLITFRAIMTQTSQFKID